MGHHDPAKASLPDQERRSYSPPDLWDLAALKLQGKWVMRLGGEEFDRELRSQCPKKSMGIISKRVPEQLCETSRVVAYPSSLQTLLFIQTVGDF